MISIRNNKNEILIIQNFTRELLRLLSYTIGGYSIFNLISMLRMDINFSYKFFSLFLIVGFLQTIKLYYNGKLINKIYTTINDREIVIEIKQKKEKKIYLLKDIKEINIKKIDNIFRLELQVEENIIDRTIYSLYSSELRLIRKLIFECRSKGEKL
ncbi:MAG: hypothetical protein SOY60_08790 [Fusobacterium gastrosuis]|uniref:hypothetical protein n=1 Tax=Fusobacterium TaxID=848 RepID=UPI0025C1B3EC|nr:hypothetical protein [Fusobacterium sp.]MCI7223186.1 hypothetical protein [Fusobacterium sp.]MDD7410892.1 hypothetical protein [Fusobacteriaceae bacterium]MDY4011751.1 hypothetical protein [Fusobacterium gastrosuis]MDY5713245.1 hypothetical protein [Fusobacterium gastrosuis]